METNLALQRRIHSCFQGRIARNCSTCPAHHTKSGKCCFGLRFEADDVDQCGQCRHADDCERETEQYNLSRVGTRRVDWRYRSDPPSIPVRTIQQPAKRIDVRRGGDLYTRSGEIIPIGSCNPEASGFEVFLKESVWEGIRGLVRGALYFLEGHYWR